MPCPLLAKSWGPPYSSSAASSGGGTASPAAASAISFVSRSGGVMASPYTSSLSAGGAGGEASRCAFGRTCVVTRGEHAEQEAAPREGAEGVERWAEDVEAPAAGAFGVDDGNEGRRIF